jgi:hypothetical protein
LEEVSSDKFSGEAAQESIFLWRGFFIGSKRKEGASFQWREQQRERAHQGFERILLRFGYLGKWSPCAYESLSTKGEDYYPCTLLYDSNFTLT